MSRVRGRFLLYLALVAGGALFGLVISNVVLPRIFESTSLFIALVFSLLVLGFVLLVRAFLRGRSGS
jgi:positive regulator of sigma E activity